MMTRRFWILFVFGALGVAFSATQVWADEFMIHDGDRVVFWGDSITDNALYVRSIEKYVRGRYPARHVDFFNLGWGGDTADSVKRMERDLVPVKPTLVFLMLGMNDAQYRPFDEGTASRYIMGMDRLTTLARSRLGARVVLITPTPYEPGIRADESGKKLDEFYPAVMRKMSERLIDYGQKASLPVVDLNLAYAQTVADLKAKDPSFQFTVDSIHPNRDGQALLAFLLLRNIGADGKFLNLVIDAKDGQTLASDGQSISDLTADAQGLSFTRRVQAVPFRVSGSPVGIDFSPWFDELNQNRLTVRNLPAPYYELRVGDKTLKVLSRAELEQGVNLTNLDLPLPETLSAIQLARAVDDIHFARYSRWRKDLLKGVNSPTQTSAYLPETAESQSLSDKAQAMVESLTRGGVTCAPYQIKLIATETAPAATESRPSAVLDLRSQGGSPWAGNGKLETISEKEGPVWQLSYDLGGVWWGGLSYRFWQNIDLSQYHSLRITYKGPGPGHNVSIILSSAGEGGGNKSEGVEVGPASAEYRTVEIPLENFRNLEFDPTKVSELLVNVSGTQTGTGVLRIKDILFGIVSTDR
jgi:lysophospholipase L1-like esterase